MWRATRTRRSARPSASRRGRRRRNCRGRAPGYGNRWRTSRESGSHDGRTVRAEVGGGGAGLPSPPGDAARGDVAGHRGAPRRPPAAGSDLAPGAALGRGHRGGAGAGHRHRPVDGGAAAHRPGSGRGGRGPLAYRVAAAQYLTRTEALLTGFRSEARSGQADAQFARQARDLLGTTRLMLDSPAAQDGRLKGLLEDLELVLAQIAQLPPRADTEEVQLINQGLEQRSVLLRLRTANPAGPGPVRTQGAL